METVASPALWAGFLGFVVAMLALDLGVFHRKEHAIGLREAAGWSAFWILLALGFNALVFSWFGPEKGMQFTAGYLLEKALAVDNIFVFVILFTTFSVPPAWQHRVLFWGILGALLMRGVFIAAGAALVQRFDWILYLFGALLLVTAFKLLFAKEEAIDPHKNPVLRFVRRFVPMTDDYRGSRFFVREGAKWLATPLFAVLVLVEVTDVLFAVDSIPAIFAVTQDPFIVFTSNIFAILGLRSLYFLLADVVHRFHYLKPALAMILAFIGGKLLLHGVVHVPIAVSLGVVGVCLSGGVILSLGFPKPHPEAVPIKVNDGS